MIFILHPPCIAKNSWQFPHRAALSPEGTHAWPRPHVSTTPHKRRAEFKAQSYTSPHASLSRLPTCGSQSPHGAHDLPMDQAKQASRSADARKRCVRPASFRRLRPPWLLPSPPKCVLRPRSISSCD
ncbi:hypothetical protein GQ54DRAFT_93897 [Martensiomyces pterosporus]|nr:hypothetical protein GQ54DRAFT_93897 [Martensiomyces pterosporus]